ncbi:MAG: MFS transporter [Paracoccaceae bacterium]
MSQRSPRSLAEPGDLTRMAALVVATAFIFNFMMRGFADTFIVFVLPLEAEFGWARSDITATYSIYLLVTGVMSPVAGLLLDRFGPRATYIAGVLLLAAAMRAAASAEALWQIYLSFGLLCGLAASLLGMVPAAALIGRWYDRNMSIAIAIAYCGMGLGILVMAPLGQIMIDAWGWRAAWRALSVVALLALPLLILLPLRRMGEGRAGAASRGRSSQQAASWPGVTVRTALRTREFWLLAQVFFFTACAIYSITIQAVPYLIENGYAPIEAAFAYGSTGLLSICGMLTAGALAARIGFRTTATISFAGTLIGTLALFSFPLWPGVIPVAIWAVAFGSCQGGRGPIVSTLTARIFAGGSVGAIFGAVYMTMSFGSALGAWGSGALHDLTGGYQAAFIFSIICVALAVAPFWLSRRLSAAAPLGAPAAKGNPA